MKFVQLKLIVLLLATGFICADVLAQDTPSGQSAFVQRRLAAMPMKVFVRGGGDWAASKPVAPGVVFGSFGVSAAWSGGTIKYEYWLGIRRKDSKDQMAVQWGGLPRDFLTFNGSETNLPVLGENVGLMSYGALRLELVPGEYEVVEAWARPVQINAFPPSAIRIRKFQPLPFRVEPGRPAYLGRLTLVPVLLDPGTIDGRPEREKEMNPAVPALVIAGFSAWMQDALEADRKLALIKPDETIVNVGAELARAYPDVFRLTVRPDEIDHAGKPVR